MNAKSCGLNMEYVRNVCKIDVEVKCIMGY